MFTRILRIVDFAAYLENYVTFKSLEISIIIFVLLLNYTLLC